MRDTGANEHNMVCVCVYALHVIECVRVKKSQYVEHEFPIQMKMKHRYRHYNKNLSKTCVFKTNNNTRNDTENLSLEQSLNNTLI